MIFAAILTVALALDARCAYAAPEQIPRTATGEIKRSTAARAAFVRLHPCPATGEVTGACDGWQVDHIVPMVSGGADAPLNMQWLPVAIKVRGRHPQAKDAWEQRVYRCWAQ